VRITHSCFRIPIQSVMFHQSRPIMFICTGSHVYLYDLQRQCLVKTLINGGHSMSCIAAHPGGGVDMFMRGFMIQDDSVSDRQFLFLLQEIISSWVEMTEGLLGMFIFCTLHLFLRPAGAKSKCATRTDTTRP
jgi:hypothetical protein